MDYCCVCLYYYSCWDYITITPGAFGSVPICDPAEPGPKLLKTLDTDGSYTLIFRSGECNHDGKKWVKKMRNNDCQNYHRGFELHTICGKLIIINVYSINYCSDTVQETYIF